MKSLIQLYSGPLSMFGMKTYIAALEKNLHVELILVPYSDEQGYFPKHTEVMRINPKEQVPVLIHKGLELFDSTQIFEYFEDLVPTPNLWPTSIKIRAKARLLEHQADEVFFPHVVKLMYLQDDLLQIKALQAIDACKAYYQFMEQTLKDQDYFTGQITYADIGFYMAQLFGERMGAVMNQQTPKLLDWRNRMNQRKSVQTGIQPLVNFLNKVNRPIPKYLHFLKTQ